MQDELVQFSISLPPQLINEIDQLAREGYRTRRKQIWLMVERELQRIRQEANEEADTPSWRAEQSPPLTDPLRPSSEG